MIYILVILILFHTGIRKNIKACWISSTPVKRLILYHGIFKVKNLTIHEYFKVTELNVYHSKILFFCAFVGVDIFRVSHIVEFSTWEIFHLGWFRVGIFHVGIYVSVRILLCYFLWGYYCAIFCVEIFWMRILYETDKIDPRYGRVYYPIVFM